MARKLFITRRRPEFVVLRRAMSVLSSPSPGSTIVDVGANIGTTTVPALLEHGFARAVACEPGVEALKMLRLNLAANDLTERVVVVAAAVSNVNGVASLATDTSDLGTRRISLVTTGTTVDVPTITLDALVEQRVIAPENVALLWIDVQGHEGHVLDGAPALLAERPPLVLALRRQKLTQARGVELLIAALEAEYRHVINLRAPGLRADAWNPTVEPVAAVRRYLAGRPKTDILALPA